MWPTVPYPTDPEGPHRDPSSASEGLHSGTVPHPVNRSVETKSWYSIWVTSCLRHGHPPVARGPPRQGRDPAFNRGYRRDTEHTDSGRLPAYAGSRRRRDVHERAIRPISHRLGTRRAGNRRVLSRRNRDIQGCDPTRAPVVDPGSGNRSPAPVCWRVSRGCCTRFRGRHHRVGNDRSRCLAGTLFSGPLIALDIASVSRRRTVSGHYPWLSIRSSGE